MRAAGLRCDIGFLHFWHFGPHRSDEFSTLLEAIVKAIFRGSRGCDAALSLLSSLTAPGSGIRLANN
jgi:hypothetical protein